MVIYSTSSLGVFQQPLLVAGAFLIAGVIGILVALFRRMRKIKGWLGLALGCLFLAGIGVVLLVVTFKNMSTNLQSVTASLDSKQAVQQSCGDPPCNNYNYVLSMTSAPKTYDFTVSKATYDKMQEGLCYQVSYYNGTGLFGTPPGSDLYVTSSYIAAITQLDGANCA